MKKSYNFQVFFMLIPVLISILGAFSSNIKTNIKVGLISIAIMFILVFCLRIAKRNENLWVFVLSFFITTPVNIKIIMFLKENTYFLGYSTFIIITVSIVIFLTLQSIEEIVFGIIARAIRPSQRDFDECYLYRNFTV